MKNDTSIARELGFGTQGIVLKSEHNTAIKVHDLLEGYERERDVYLRLKERSIQSIQDFSIPRFVDSDDELYVVEMSIVHVPCILDFGSTYLDSAPEHLTRDEFWIEQKSEEFANNWDKAQEIVRELEFLANIWLADVNTGNIKFHEDN